MDLTVLNSLGNPKMIVDQKEALAKMPAFSLQDARFVPRLEVDPSSIFKAGEGIS